MLIVALLFALCAHGVEFATKPLSLGFESEMQGASIMFAPGSEDWFVDMKSNQVGSNLFFVEKGHAFSKTDGAIDGWPYIKLTPDLPKDNSGVTLEYVIAPVPLAQADYHTAIQRVMTTMNEALRDICLVEQDLVTIEGFDYTTMSKGEKTGTAQGVWFSDWRTAVNTKIVSGLFDGLQIDGSNVNPADWKISDYIVKDAAYKIFISCSPDNLPAFPGSNQHISYGVKFSQLWSTITTQVNDPLTVAPAQKWTTKYLNDNEILKTQKEDTQLQSLFGFLFWDCFVHASTTEVGSSLKNKFGHKPRTTVASLTRALKPAVRTVVANWRAADGVEELKGLALCVDPATGQESANCHGLANANRNLEVIKAALTTNLENEAKHFEYDASFEGETEQAFGYGPTSSTSTSDIPMFLLQGGSATDTCLVVEHRTSPPPYVNPKSEGTPKDASQGDFKKMLDHYLWLSDPQGVDPLPNIRVELADIRQARQANPLFGGGNPFSAGLKASDLKKQNKKKVAKPVSPEAPELKAESPKSPIVMKDIPKSPTVVKESPGPKSSGAKLPTTPDKEKGVMHAMELDERTEVRASEFGDNTQLYQGLAAFGLMGIVVFACYKRTAKGDNYYQLVEEFDEI